MCVCVRVCMSYTINLTLQYTPATALATDAARVARLHGSGAGASGSRPSARACSSRARCSHVGRVTDAQPYTARAMRAGAHGTRHTHGTHTYTHTRVARTKETGTQVLGTSHTHSPTSPFFTLEKGALGLSSPGVHLMSVCTSRASAAHNGASGPLHTGTRTQRGRGCHWW
jgi:hypothetical protein